MFYIYILYSAVSDKYYVGQSEDPWARFEHHNSDDKDTYTSKHRPWEFAAVFQVSDSRAGALKIERWIKKQKSRTLLEKLIAMDFVPLVGASMPHALAGCVLVPAACSMYLLSEN